MRLINKDTSWSLGDPENACLIIAVIGSTAMMDLIACSIAVQDTKVMYHLSDQAYFGVTGVIRILLDAAMIITGVCLYHSVIEKIKGQLLAFVAIFFLLILAILSVDVTMVILAFMYGGMSGEAIFAIVLTGLILVVYLFLAYLLIDYYKSLQKVEKVHEQDEAGQADA